MVPAHSLLKMDGAFELWKENYLASIYRVQGSWSNFPRGLSPGSCGSNDANDSKSGLTSVQHATVVLTTHSHICTHRCNGTHLTFTVFGTQKYQLPVWDQTTKQAYRQHGRRDKATALVLLDIHIIVFGKEISSIYNDTHMIKQKQTQFSLDMTRHKYSSTAAAVYNFPRV